MTGSNKSPYATAVAAGKTYFWCACGQSKNQPFCDGSHKTTLISPVIFKSDDDKTVHLCGCKKTGNGPYCDGTHSRLGTE